VRISYPRKLIIFLSERRSREHVRCFFRGEAPEDMSERLRWSEGTLSNTLGTTILHEAVLASCYSIEFCVSLKPMLAKKSDA